MRLNSRCGHPPDRLAEVTGEYRWPPGTVVTWAVDTDSPLPNGLTADQVVAALSAAVGKWTSASGLVAQHLPTGSPRVLVQFAGLDPTGVELGLTELPAAGVAQVTLQLNSLVSWTAQELAEVATHEVGHALGLGHCTDGSTAIMNPVYNPGLDDLQPWDLGQIDQRYPAAAPAPTTDTSALPTLTLGRQVIMSVTYAQAGPSILGLAFGSANTAMVNVDVPSPGTYNFTIDFETAPKTT